MLCAGNAHADTGTANPSFTTSSAHIEYQWHDPSYDYGQNSGAGARMPIAFSEVPEDLGAQPEAAEEVSATDKDKGQDYADKILAKIPYNKQLKSTWKFVDGETDIYVKNLRVDRGNKGVEYKTDYVPFMGAVDGVMFKAEVGEDSKMKFESSHIPFVGNVEGFKFKSSVGEESSVSVRYTTSFEKLGL